VWQHIVRPSWRSAWPQLPVSSWVPRAPGVGKTTLVEKGIAKALGLPYNARPRRAGDVCMLGHSYTVSHGHIVGASTRRAVNRSSSLTSWTRCPRAPGSRELSHTSHRQLPESQVSGQIRRVIWTCPGGHDLLVQRSRQGKPTLLDRMNVVKTGGYSRMTRRLFGTWFLRPSQRTVSTVPWQTCCLPEVVDRLVRSWRTACAP
jgi:hypothetical protein